MTFTQQTEMQKLIQTIARMDLPTGERTVDDAAALYALIEQARAVLKMKDTKR